jgi:hypothetical protein
MVAKPDESAACSWGGASFVTCIPEPRLGCKHDSANWRSMLKLIVAVSAALLSLTACVTAKTTHLPNGNTGYAIHCNGAMHDIADCMDKAAEICGGPYQIFTSTGEVVSSTAVATGTSPYTSVATSVNGIQRTLIVECGAPAASTAGK